MDRKLTRTGSVPRKTNIFGWLRNRGGAGAVAAATALAIAAVLVSISFAATASSPSANYHEENPIPVDRNDAVPLEPKGQTATTVTHGAGPLRLPC